MRPARIILAIVALVAGGLAAFLVTRMGQPPTTTTEVVTEVVQEAKTQILVAKAAIGIGQRLSPDSVEWQDWPQGALRPEYVTISALPDAPQQLSDAVARFEFFPGEPIREQKLVRSDQGYLSAVLAPGMRGVSVSVNAASSAGGFVVPNDHVDVVLTTSTPAGQQSEVVLSNVRILAIGKRLGELGTTAAAEDGNAVETATPVTFDNTTIATLELTPNQAEALINASMRGQLSLTLRSVVDFGRSADSGRPATSQSVRVFRFGKEESVLAGGMAQAETGPVPAEQMTSDNNAGQVQVESVDPSLVPQ
ncbi:Flp pilus assembly protein CpaB [Devosia soli]|uniref:Flp pilus assembly protein CpaB n=1 Tax=Devosia soli TaxID=361041 RepID=UPI000A01F681|nr:Flp pilus assembly protein CpaB [Devosia soli]